jgi:hypothetical protein
MFSIAASDYQNRSPFPYTAQDNFFDQEFAKKLQEEILAIPLSEFDEYRNPCEKKRTFRNKDALPRLCQEFFNRMTSPSMIEHLNEITGHSLLVDEHKQYWGIHIFDKDSKLAVHVDAGVHPKNGLKKQVTFGYYLSVDWKEEYGSQLEIWEGESAGKEDPKLLHLADRISPLFNRAVLFTCNDYSWHGVSDELADKPESVKRIFLTLSYLSESTTDTNKRTRAFFVPRDTDENREEILEFSKKRASASAADYYRTY